MRRQWVVVVAAFASCTCLQPVEECARRTCAEQGKDCGTITDGCGGTLDCGACAAPQQCGGSGPNRCGSNACLSTTCAALGAECGMVPNGCSALLTCGTCGAGQSCVANHCTAACTPRTCAQQLAQCGRADDGCGGTLDCGACQAPLACNANRCVSTCTPRTCAATMTECGPVEDGCGGFLGCGTCQAPQTCASGRCVCSSPACMPPAANAWRTLGGDIGHSGFNALEQGTPPLTLRWTAPLSATASPVVTDGVRVFAVTWQTLTTLDAADGGVQWSHSFPSVHSVGHPAVFDGQVYVAHCNHSSDTKLWAFDPQTGATTFSVAMSAQWEQYWAPIKVGNGVYTNGGSYGGLYGFDATTGANLFFNSTLAQYDEWSPASDGTLVYVFVAGHFEALNASTGVRVWDVQVTWNWRGWSMMTSPALANGMAYVIAPPNLYAIDLTTHAVRWSTTGLTFTGTPAVANGVVYAVSAGNVRAHDAATGAYLWTFVGDGALSYPPVLTSTHLYAASNAAVFAADLATHAQVWTAPGGGWLSLANGSLFVAGQSTPLKAYSLTPP